MFRCVNMPIDSVVHKNVKLDTRTTHLFDPSPGIFTNYSRSRELHHAWLKSNICCENDRCMMGCDDFMTEPQQLIRCVYLEAYAFSQSEFARPHLIPLWDEWKITSQPPLFFTTSRKMLKMCFGLPGLLRTTFELKD